MVHMMGETKNSVVSRLEKFLRAANETDLEAFREFLREHQSNENLTFWVEVEEFKSMFATETNNSDQNNVDENLLKEKASKIYRKYFTSISKYELNIADTIRKKVHESLASPHHDMFNDSQQSILKLLAEESFPRFLQIHFGGDHLSSSVTNSNEDSIGEQERKLRSTDSYMAFQNYLVKRRSSAPETTESEPLPYSLSASMPNVSATRDLGIMIRIIAPQLNIQTRVNNRTMTVAQFLTKQLRKIKFDENETYGLYLPTSKEWLDETKMVYDYQEALENPEVTLELKQKHK